MKSPIVCKAAAQDSQPRQAVRNFADSVGERSPDMIRTAPMIDGAKGLRPPRWPLGNHAIPKVTLFHFSQIQHRFKHLARECGHIARGYEIPIGRTLDIGELQGRMNARQRASARHGVGHDGVSKISVSSRITHQGDGSRSLADNAGRAIEQTAVSNLEKSLVRPHARTVAADQHEARPTHREMIPLSLKSDFSTVHQTTIMHFCFIISAIMAAAALAFAETPRRITTVVRADERSGRLVRSVVVMPKVISAQALPMAPEPVPAEPVAISGMETMIDRIAEEQAVEGPLVHSVIKAESNYNPFAISPKGALGMMQLIPATARRFGVANSFNPKQNVEGGVRYLRYLLELYKGDYPKAIAAYNAGEAAVARYGGIPPYPETRNYVLQVARNLKVARQHTNGKPKPAPAAHVETARAATYNPIRASVREDGRVYYRTP